MSILPQQLALHLAKVDPADGTWLIAVASVSETQSGKDVLLKLVLEQNIDEETVRSRELGLVVSAAVILDPETCADVVDRIRKWIETTDGDGFLDLVRLYS